MIIFHIFIDWIFHFTSNFHRFTTPRLQRCAVATPPSVHAGRSNHRRGVHGALVTGQKKQGANKKPEDLGEISEYSCCMYPYQLMGNP